MRQGTIKRGDKEIAPFKNGGHIANERVKIALDILKKAKYNIVELLETSAQEFVAKITYLSLEKER